MRFGARLVAVGAFAALAAACSSTVTTTNDGVGDEDAATPADSGTGVAPRDASTAKDSAAPDAAPPRDASPPPPIDAGPPPDAAPPIDAGPPRDASPPPDAAVDASPPPDAGRDAAPPAACYVPDDALALTAAAPTLSPSICTAAQIVGAQTACLGPASTAATCNAYLGANRACGRCIFGALSGDVPATTPVGALIPVSDTSVTPSIGACASLVIGRPDCALPISQQTVCTNSACATCADTASDDACQGAASLGICAGLGDGACNAAIDATVGTWGPRCRGAAFNDTYLKVATVMCGAP